MVKFSVYLNGRVFVIYLLVYLLNKDSNQPSYYCVSYICHNAKKTNLGTYTLNEDSNQPSHPHSLIRVYLIRMNLKLCILGNRNCNSDQSEGTFSHVEAHISKLEGKKILLKPVTVHTMSIEISFH